MKRRALFALGALVVAAGAGEIALRLTPFPAALAAPPPLSTEFLDRAGRPLRTLLVDERQYARACPLAQISPFLIDATLSAEDQRFYSHHGLDPLAIARASWNFLGRREAVSGASTITQQLVKIARPGPRTLRRKLAEAWLALRVERSWSKERILAEYLNRLDYGDLQTGIASASAHYFGKPPSDLSAAEAALLAGLPKAPTRLNPHAHPAEAEQRRRWVLTRLLATHRLDSAAAARALSEPLHLVPPGRAYAAPHFVDLLLSRRALIPEHGGPLRTTLDLDLNRFAEHALLQNLRALGDKHATGGAAVVLDNATGDVLALACATTDPANGAADVNTAWMIRSPGSAMKPFTYLLALQRGAHPGTVVADVPTDFATDTGSYRPNNYNHRFYGPVSLRFALGNSLNVAAIRALELAGGPDALQQAMRGCGVTTLDHPSDYYGLGLTLGNGEVRLLELTNAFATLARLGAHRPFRLLQHEAPATSPGERVFDSGAAFLLADMLSDNRARAASFGLDSFLAFDFPVAVKTGTSSDYRDNWCLGYTPEFTVGVWVGNPNGQPMRGITGVTGAAPVLHDLFEHLHATRGTSWYATPPSVRSYPIEPLTGRLVAETTPGALREKCIAPPPPATASDYDETRRVLLPSPYAEWLSSPQNTLGSVATLSSSSSSSSSSSNPPAPPSFEILAPSPGSIFFLDPDLPLTAQRIPLRASLATPLDWTSPTLPLSHSRAQLLEGRHLLTARDPLTGRLASTWIEVKPL